MGNTLSLWVGHFDPLKVSKLRIIASASKENKENDILIFGTGSSS